MAEVNTIDKNIDAVAASLLTSEDDSGIVKTPPNRKPPVREARARTTPDETLDDTEVDTDEQEGDDLDEYQDVEEEDANLDEEEEEEDTDEDEDYDEDSDEEPTAADIDDDTVVAVTVDGEQVEVPLRDLKRAYSLKGATQNRLREITDIKKQTLEQAQINRDYTMRMVSAVADVLFTPSTKPPEQDLMATNLHEYLFRKEAHTNELQEIEQRKQGILRQLTEMQSEIEKQKQSYRAAEQERLFEALPVLNDPERGPRFEKELFAFAEERYGIDKKLLASIDNHVAFLVLTDAMRLNKLLQKRAVVPQKSAAKSIVKRASAVKNEKNRTSTDRRNERRATEKAWATGKPDDVALAMITRKPRRR